MAYWKETSSIGNNSKIHTPGIGGQILSSNSMSEFYELEEALVLDVIYDENHPEIKNLVPEQWPDNFKGEIADKKDKNFTYIGRIKFRLLNSQKNIPKEILSWAKPLHCSGVVEIPLLNEVVIVVKYRNEWFYHRRLNVNGIINSNANFDIEKTEGNTSGNRQNDISNENKKIVNVTGPVSYTGPKSIKTGNHRGVLGEYYLQNNKIRTVKKYEGDTAIESRHGQSIRFSAYDSNRQNDVGDSRYPDYAGCGNPMILIRNRQRPLGNDKGSTSLHPKLNPIPIISPSEKNAGGQISEDINNDGSSIHITSGKTESQWKTTVYKKIFSREGEEQSLYSPEGCTDFSMPLLNGDQIVIQTDRIIFSSRFGETLHYSKKRYSVVTDSEFTVDSDDQIVLTTNDKIALNSPVIYLGQYDQTNEPAMLGQTTVNWLYDLCEWLKGHVHYYKHSHPDAGEATPEKTQLSVQMKQLEALQKNLSTLLSRRVFLTGGGFAPGADGVSPTGTDSTSSPTKINVATGEGVPGGFKGKNRR